MGNSQQLRRFTGLDLRGLTTEESEHGSIILGGRDRSLRTVRLPGDWSQLRDMTEWDWVSIDVIVATWGDSALNEVLNLADSHRGAQNVSVVSIIADYFQSWHVIHQAVLEQADLGFSPVRSGHAKIIEWNDDLTLQEFGLLTIGRDAGPLYAVTEGYYLQQGIGIPPSNWNMG